MCVRRARNLSGPALTTADLPVKTQRLLAAERNRESRALKQFKDSLTKQVPTNGTIQNAIDQTSNWLSSMDRPMVIAPLDLMNVIVEVNIDTLEVTYVWKHMRAASEALRLTAATLSTYICQKRIVDSHIYCKALYLQSTLKTAELYQRKLNNNHELEYENFDK